MALSDPNTGTNTADGPSHEWKMKPPPPRVYTSADLDIHYRNKRGAWFRVLFADTTGYLARRVPECPPGTTLHYALRPSLVEACLGLDLLPKDEES